MEIERHGARSGRRTPHSARETDGRDRLQRSNAPAPEASIGALTRHLLAPAGAPEAHELRRRAALREGRGDLLRAEHVKP